MESENVHKPFDKIWQNFKSMKDDDFEDYLSKVSIQPDEFQDGLLDQKYGHFENTMLHICAMKRETAKARSLIRYGASQIVKNATLDTPLHLCTISQSFEMTEAILTEKHNNCTSPMCFCGYNALSEQNNQKRKPKDTPSTEEITKYLIEQEILHLASCGKNMKHLCTLIANKTDSVYISEDFFKNLLKRAIDINYLSLIAFIVLKMSDDLKEKEKKNAVKGELENAVRIANEKFKEHENQPVEPFFLLLVCFELLDKTKEADSRELILHTGKFYDFVSYQIDDIFHSPEMDKQYGEFISNDDNIRLIIIATPYCSDEVKLALLCKLHNDTNETTDWHCLNLSTISTNWLEKIKSTKSLILTDNKLIDKLSCMQNLTTLQKLQISSNGLKIVTKDIFELPCLRELNLSHNSLKEIPKNIKFTPVLSIVYIGHNHLNKLPSCFAKSLISNLDLCYNHFESLPLCLCKMKMLTTLDLNGNSRLMRFPNEMGWMRSDCVISLDDMDQLVYPVSFCAPQQPGSQHKLITYHRQRLNQTERNNKMNLFVIGPENNGKSTLIASLLRKDRSYVVTKTDKTIQQNQNKHGDEHNKAVDEHNKAVEKGVKFCEEPLKIQSRFDNYYLNIIDFPGAIEYSPNQCFFTERALYLLVWNINLSPEILEEWLNCLKMYVPNANIAIVGKLQGDKCLGNNERLGKQTELCNWLTENKRRYCSFNFGIQKDNASDNFGRYWFSFVNDSPHNSKGFGVKRFKKRLAKLALSIKNQTTGQLVLGEVLPRFYFKLADEIKQRVEDQRKVVYDKKQMLEILRNVKQKDQLECHRLCCDVLDKKKRDKKIDAAYSDSRDLKDATQFLHDIGVILHFNTTADLNNLHFADRLALKDALQSLSHATNGYNASSSNRSSIHLAETNPYTHHLEQILEVFHVGFRDLDNTIQLTHKMEPNLRPEDNLDLESVRKEKFTHNYHRVFVLDHIPFGFWVKFLSRLLIYLERYHLKRNCLQYWRSGVVYNDPSDKIFFEVRLIPKISETDAYDEDFLHKKSLIESIVKTEDEKAGTMLISFITDDITTVLKEWHCLIEFQQFACCVQCFSDGVLIKFTWSSCLRDMRFDSEENENMITCPNESHTLNRDIKVKEILPEILFSDHPQLVLKVCHDLKINEENVSSGSFGKVYKGTLKPHQQCRHFDKEYDVAVKEIEFEMEDKRLVEKYQKFRQEVLIMDTVREHPNIISFIGIHLSYQSENILLRIVMEWGSKSLSEYIDTKHGQLSRLFVYRSCYQIALALQFFHQKGILHRDIKSKNIMVINESSYSRVQIIDFGQSNYKNSFGLAQDTGTKRYYAPEMHVKKSMYTEAVDVWAFALVMYEMLTKKAPFSGIHSEDVHKYLEIGERPEFENVLSHDFIYLKKLIQKTWTESPLRRPSAEMLTRILQSSCFQLCANVLKLEKTTNASFFITSGLTNFNLLDEFYCYYGKHVYFYTVDENNSSAPAKILKRKEISKENIEVCDIFALYLNAVAVLFKTIDNSFRIKIFYWKEGEGTVSNASAENMIARECHDNVESVNVAINQQLGKINRIFPIPSTTSEISFYCYQRQGDTAEGYLTRYSISNKLCRSQETEKLGSVQDFLFLNGTFVLFRTDKKIKFYTNLDEVKKTITLEKNFTNVLYDKNLILGNLNQEEQSSSYNKAMLIVVTATGGNIELIKIKIELKTEMPGIHPTATSLVYYNSYIWIGLSSGHILICNITKDGTVNRLKEIKPYIDRPVENLIKCGNFVISNSTFLNSYAFPEFETIATKECFFTRDFLTNDGSYDVDASDLLLFWDASEDIEAYPTDPEKILKLSSAGDQTMRTERSEGLKSLMEFLAEECGEEDQQHINNEEFSTTTM